MIKLAAVWVGAMVLLAVIGLVITVVTRSSARRAEVPPAPLQAVPVVAPDPTPPAPDAPRAAHTPEPLEPDLEAEVAGWVDEDADDPRADDTAEGGSGVRARLRSGTAAIRGGLSRELIQRVFRRHTGEVRHCYERELSSSPDLAGRVTVRIIVSPTGRVQTAMVQASTLGNQRVERCIESAVQRWTFPPPDGGGIVIINYPLALSTD